MQVNNNLKICIIDRDIWHGLTITDSAAHQIRYLVENNPGILGLRLSVIHSGCAGLRYVIEKAIYTDHNDQVYEYNNARIYVTLKTMPFIDGTELNYIQEGLNHVFKFNNPKAKHACGCGESFNF